MRRRQLPGLTRNDMEEWAEENGFPRYRGRQLFAWIHRRRRWDPREMTDPPAAFRDLVSRRGDPMPAQVESVARSRMDATAKLLIKLRDGLAIETVQMRSGSRVTVCFST